MHQLEELTPLWKSSFGIRSGKGWISGLSIEFILTLKAAQILTFSRAIND